MDKINQKGSIIHSSKSSLLHHSSKDIREEDILYSIQSILYPSEILSTNKTFISFFYQNLVFYMKIIFLKFRLINNYLSLNDFFDLNNKYNSPKTFLKQIIKCARKKPFLFLKELQNKLNFILNPYILFKSSLSIESMKNKLEKKYIYINNNINYSYINNEEIKGIFLLKIINNSKNIDNNIINKNLTNKSIKLVDKFETDSQMNIKQLNSYNYIDNESHNSTYDSRKNNILYYDNLSLLVTKLNISDSLEAMPKFKEECEIIYDNKYLTETVNALLKDFIIQLPSNCYKMYYNNENSEKNILLGGELNNEYSIYKNFKQYYKISDVKILYNWFECIDNLFSDVLSYNGNNQHILLKVFVFKFIIAFFVEKSSEKARNILMKIKEIYNNGIGYIISINDLAIIILLEGLFNENNNELSILEKESSYSKSLILLLMNYGDPRGRKNDSHDILLFPIWKILKKIYDIEKNSLIYDYFKEMFLSLDFTIKSRYKLDKYNDNDIDLNKAINKAGNFTKYKYKKNNNYPLNYKIGMTKDSLNLDFSNKNYKKMFKVNNNDLDENNFLSDDIYNKLFLITI